MGKASANEEYARKTVAVAELVLSLCGAVAVACLHWRSPACRAALET